MTRFSGHSSPPRSRPSGLALSGRRALTDRRAPSTSGSCGASPAPKPPIRPRWRARPSVWALTSRRRWPRLREDLVHTDSAGAIAVAYPFSGQPTRHRVCLGEHDVYAMCAIDALGMAPMFKVAVLIDSLDPVTGDAIRVELAADGHASWTPEDAVVVAGSCCAGDAYEGCCQVLNFFAAPPHAEQYLAERPEVSGHVISIPEAIEAGRAIFGDVFGDTR